MDGLGLRKDFNCCFTISFVIGTNITVNLNLTKVGRDREVVIILVEKQVRLLSVDVKSGY